MQNVEDAGQYAIVKRGWCRATHQPKVMRIGSSLPAESDITYVPSTTPRRFWPLTLKMIRGYAGTSMVCAIHARRF